MGHDTQFSLVLHTMSPHLGALHATHWPTQASSQAVLQQNASCAQTQTSQGLSTHPGLALAGQLAWQVPQSLGQLAHDSPPS